jgi:hypothetical protein
MRPSSFPDPEKVPLQAGIFASDLRNQCEELFEVFAARRLPEEVGGVPVEVLRLPITIPFNEDDLVLLGPANLDCAKKPATLELVRFQGRGRHGPRYRFGIGLALTDGGPLRVPGVNASGIETDPPVPVHELTFAVADRGLAIVGYGAEGVPLDLRLTENTACLLATALIITLGVKLTKAERGFEE